MPGLGRRREHCAGDCKRTDRRSLAGACRSAPFGRAGPGEMKSDRWVEAGRVREGGLSSVFPVAGFSTSVGYSKDQDSGLRVVVDDRVGVVAKDVALGGVLIDGPRVRDSADCRYGVVDLVGKRLGGFGGSFGVPAVGCFEFGGGLRVEFKFGMAHP